MHIVSVDQFTPEIIGQVFERANELGEQLQSKEGKKELITRHPEISVCSFFYEPSTRTSLSFVRAAQALGAQVSGTENAGDFSSATKGETLEDTIRVLDGYYYGAIILRHFDDGSAQRASEVARQTPLINAGDGKGEHPTQTLLDLYTIQQAHGRLNGLNVVIGGDLAHGRTTKSLAKMLARYAGNHLYFISTPELQMTSDITDVLDKSGTTYTKSNDLDPEILGKADVVYWTRLQKERIQENIKVVSSFVIDKAIADMLPGHAIIMHPLPKVGEIDTEVDSHPKAWYFRQAHNGVPVRLALLDLIFNEEI